MKSVKEVRGSDSDVTFIDDKTILFDDPSIANTSCVTISNFRPYDDIPNGVAQTSDASAYTGKYELAAEGESDEELEVPRGDEPAPAHQETNDEVTLQMEDKKERGENDTKRVEQFLKDLVENPAWARSLSNVKLDADLPKEVQWKLITHALIHVNLRPKLMTMLTKNMDAKDLTHIITLAFDSVDLPLERSLFRIRCVNLVPDLKPLIRSILSAAIQKNSVSMEIKYTAVFGKIRHRGKILRSKTYDLKGFCSVEKIAKELGMNFSTTFSCRSPIHRNRVLFIRYYDESKRTGERVTLVEIDHESSTSCVTFKNVVTVCAYKIDDEHMAPLRKAHDLISLVHKLSSSH